MLFYSDFMLIDFFISIDILWILCDDCGFEFVKLGITSLWVKGEKNYIYFCIIYLVYIFLCLLYFWFCDCNGKYEF